MAGPTHGQNRGDPEVAGALIESIRYSGKTYRIGIILGQCFGGIVCLGGLLLILLGISGQIQWIVEAGALRSRLANASPGALFAVIGLLLLWRYKPMIRDDFSVRPGSRFSSLHRSQKELESLSNLQALRGSEGDEIRYKGLK